MSTVDDTNQYRLNWEGNGFSYSAFQRWRELDRFGFMSASLRARTMMNVSRNEISQRLIDEALYPPASNGDASVNPEWANHWADVVNTLEDAMVCHLVGMKPSDIGLMKSLRFKSITSMQGYFAVLNKAGLIDRLRSFELSLASIPKTFDATKEYTSERGKAIVKLVATAMDLTDRLPITQTQLNLFLSNCPRLVGFKMRATSGSAHRNAQWMDRHAFDTVEAYTDNMNLYLDLYMEQFGKMPDDEMFQMLCGRAPVRYISSYGINPISNLLESVADEEAVRHVLDTVYYSDVHSIYQSKLALKMTYSITTGIPMEWITDDMLEPQES